MPSSTPHSLVITDTQQEVLQELGISLSSIYIIEGDALHETVRVDAYTNGHYVFFLAGNSVDHANFLRHLYGIDYKISLPSRFRGITIYGSPTERFVKSVNVVNVSSAPNTLITYGD